MGIRLVGQFVCGKPVVGFTCLSFHFQKDVTIAVHGEGFTVDLE